MQVWFHIQRKLWSQSKENKIKTQHKDTELFYDAYIRQRELYTPAICSNKKSEFHNYQACSSSPVQIEENESDERTSKHEYEQLNITSTINEKGKNDSNIHIKQEVASVIQALNPEHPKTTKYNNEKNKKINLSHFGIDSHGCSVSTPFTSINLRMEYIKNNVPKHIDEKRKLKNKSIEVIYSDARTKYHRISNNNSESSRMSKQSNRRASNNRQTSDSEDRDYRDRSDNLILKINRASKLKESMLLTSNQLKDKIRFLETQNHNLSEINQILKDKIEKYRRSNSKSPGDQNSISEKSPNKKNDYHKFCSFCIIKDTMIRSMANEIECLQASLSEACNSSNDQYFEVFNLENFIKQQEIKHDLEISHVKTKLKLLEETLTNRNKDLKDLDNFKKNNQQLLGLLERYDHKVTEMHNEVEIRDLRIKELEGITLESEKLNLDDLEIRIKFLIGLLERCRAQLEKEAVKEDMDLDHDSEDRIRLSSNFHLNRENIPDFSACTSESNSMIEVIKDFYKNRVSCESKIESGLPSLI